MIRNKEKIKHRLKRIEGQLRGVQEMIKSDKYCIDVITQTSALRGAVSALEDKLLEEHLSCCVVDQIKKGQIKKIQEEVLKIYKLAKKK